MDQLPNTGVWGEEERKGEKGKKGERTGKKGEGRGEGLVSSNKYIWGRVGGMVHVACPSCRILLLWVPYFKIEIEKLV